MIVPPIRETVRYLNLGEGGRGVVGETADPLAGVSVVEGVTSVGRGQAQVPAGLHGWHVLKKWHGIVSHFDL